MCFLLIRLFVLNQVTNDHLYPFLATKGWMYFDFQASECTDLQNPFRWQGSSQDKAIFLVKGLFWEYGIKSVSTCGMWILLYLQYILDFSSSGSYCFPKTKLISFSDIILASAYMSIYEHIYKHVSGIIIASSYEHFSDII